ncbi:MAG: RNA-binding protein [Nitrosopumilaceae archaeon]|nr:RNA-binding protein [Nitrosopumilaceae archaeon]NIU01791.1 RNA-binding protein [Nitrosopumilaceae archaeon]NIU88191.1 RNA-binding protein [Nitrosopumilaceae archaeon]NIV66514.1 RNA-binding protein [Nitrosopumilaceae archaeon]NIX62393.1 RNA-binding protein [Nitrosopumilaceae archaeon]
MKSNLISKTETNKLLEELTNSWKFEIPKVKNLKVYETEDSQIITGGGLKILKKDGHCLPFLSDEDNLKKFPYVMVDMGAVKFVCNGANIMRPGVRRYSEFSEGDIICVIEESQHKFLAVGIAQVSSSDMDEMKKGEIVKNIHYISDKYWEVGKSISD